MTGKLLTEGVGTFFLVLTIGLTVLGGLPWAPVAIGSALMVMVYMGGHISGAHYNPAVTLAVLLRGKILGREAGAYMLAQLIGALLAAIAVALLREESLVVAPGAGASALQVLLVEVLFTTALALVVLNVATSPRTEGNSYYGVAIGFTVLIGAASGGDISGGAFNPAVGLGARVSRCADRFGIRRDGFPLLPRGPLHRRRPCYLDLPIAASGGVCLRKESIAVPSRHHNRPVEELVVLPARHLRVQVVGLRAPQGVGRSRYQRMLADGERGDLEGEEGPCIRIARSVQLS